MGLSQGSKSHLECADAYALSEDFKRGALRVTTRELLFNDLALLRGEEGPLQPIEFVHDEGSRIRDWLGTTYGTLQLVSSKFIDVLGAHGFSGWGTFPVTVELADGSELEGYHGLTVTGRSGPIEESLSERITLPPPTSQGRSEPGLRGLCFEPESWDGSDVFIPEGSAWVLATESVVRALKDAGITGVVFRRCSEIELPVLRDE